MVFLLLFCFNICFHVKDLVFYYSVLRKDDRWYIFLCHKNINPEGSYNTFMLKTKAGLSSHGPGDPPCLCSFSLCMASNVFFDFLIIQNVKTPEWKQQHEHNQPLWSFPLTVEICQWFCLCCPLLFTHWTSRLSFDICQFFHFSHKIILNYYQLKLYLFSKNKVWHLPGLGWLQTGNTGLNLKLFFFHVP